MRRRSYRNSWSMCRPQLGHGLGVNKYSRVVLCLGDNKVVIFLNPFLKRPAFSYSKNADPNQKTNYFVFFGAAFFVTGLVAFLVAFAIVSPFQLF